MTGTELKPPTKPIPGWEAARDAWVRDVAALAAEVNGWCKAERWATRVIPRKLRDSRIGEHVVPALLLQVEFAELLLEPVSPNVPGTDGVVDLYLMPRYDDIASISRESSGWQVHIGSDWKGGGDLLDAPGRPFGRAVFVEIVRRMVADARQRAF